MGVAYWQYTVVFIGLWAGACSSAAVDINALLTRLEATEEYVKTLSNRVEVLESQEKIHLQRIDHQQKAIDELAQQLKQQSFPLTEDNQANMHHEADVNEGKEASMELRINNNEVPTIKERSLRGIRQAEVETPVAFDVFLGTHLDNAGVGQLFVFKEVTTNIGNAYNSLVGTFTAPVDGVYVFSVTLLSKYHVNAHAAFYRNDVIVSKMYTSGAEAGYDTASSTIVIQLQKGDLITVRNGDVNVSYYGDKYTSLSGFLLYNLNGAPAVIGK